MPAEPATPPAAGATTGKKRMNWNGNGRAVKEAGWKLVTASTLALVIGVATMLWSVNAKLAVIEATMVTDHELQETIRQEVPPDWFRNQVQRIEDNLDEHMGQTAQEGHRGGNGDNGGGGP